VKITVFSDVTPCSLVAKYQSWENIVPKSSSSTLKTEAVYSGVTLITAYLHMVPALENRVRINTELP